ncbi:MAG: NAD regulator [Ahrensia sp.]|nr:NAD regulator [Ahrensia sp.]
MTSDRSIQVGLHAAILATEGSTPLVLTLVGTSNQSERLAGLPFGPFDPPGHRTFENGLRRWVDQQTSARLGYVEQLYTFGDYGRWAADQDTHFVSVGYLALVRRLSQDEFPDAQWLDWYRFFPWEDWRDGPPAMLQGAVAPALKQWLEESCSKDERVERSNRIALGFADFGQTSDLWDEERVLERYELMYEAGLVWEAVADGRVNQARIPEGAGVAMLHDHRRILATAIARLRSKLKYRPVVFELMPPRFTLTQLQMTVETLSGRRVHKQNFRRMVEKADLVEQTGEVTAQTGGRPAALYRFRRSILRERPAPGLKIGGRGR